MCTKKVLLGIIILTTFILTENFNTISQNGNNIYASDILDSEKKLYSQHDEELIIRDFFQDRKGGVFLDVGCSDYMSFSTTYYLEKYLGWSGIAVDALPEYASGYQQHRPKTKFFNYLVTDHSGKKEPFYEVTTDKVYSTASQERLQNALKELGPKAENKVMYIPTITLNELLEKNGISKIDFLSMDIEEGEPAALAGFDIKKFRPELVCIETNKPVVRDKILDYFIHNNYERIDKYLKYDELNWYFKPKD
jgi:FkbM family methyltransferase